MNNNNDVPGALLQSDDIFVRFYYFYRFLVICPVIVVFSFNHNTRYDIVFILKFIILVKDYQFDTLGFCGQFMITIATLT